MSGLAAALVVTGAAASVSATAQEPPAECMVVGVHGRCLVIAVDPGRLAETPVGEEAQSEGDRARPVREPGASNPLSAPEPPRRRTQALPFGEGGWVRGEVPDIPLPEDPAPAGAPQAPAVPLDVVVQRAVDELLLAPPIPRMSVTGSGYVGVPVWLWIEDDGVASTGPISATASAGAAQVTATARLSAVEWSMGPPGETVRCAGPGTPWTDQDGESPDCGYTYSMRSLPDRTNGTGTWTVTATSLWTVEWSGTSGGVPVEGTETVTIANTVTLPVGEVQVLVGGADR
ncbi:hypothetical protein [Pseudonocardia hydrocarbonoxydans]|uniref:hypothetical protein n=1 Tax=Pseudonocardia hydrocarbonoxydans TaxID=76726 RepID=UPI0031DB55EC